MGLLLLMVVLVAFLKSPLNSSYGPPINIEGTERYYELVNKHPKTPEEYKEFQEEKKKLKEIEVEYFKRKLGTD